MLLTQPATSGRSPLVTLEGLSSGDLKWDNSSAILHYGLARSTYGTCTVGWTARGICHLAFQDSDRLQAVPERLRKDFPHAHYQHCDKAAQEQIDSIFNGNGSGFSSAFHLLVKGTAFQLKVWRALLTIPSGSVSTYSAIAETIGHPKAFRAVGSACGQNPIAYLIPCHRVIKSSGATSGYKWGPSLKEALLRAEGRCI